ncbi:glycine cleavage system protein R [Thermodesulfobacteriota bacterium]
MEKKSFFAISAIGKDRPGIVADITEMVYECGCNLEDSSMTILRGYFALLLLLSSHDRDIENRLSASCKRLEWEKKLTIFFAPITEAESSLKATDRRIEYELQTTGLDKAGIVYKISRLLADHGINVIDLNTKVAPSPQSGTPLYTMKIHMKVPPEIEESALREELNRLEEDLSVEITLTRTGS